MQVFVQKSSLILSEIVKMKKLFNQQFNNPYLTQKKQNQILILRNKNRRKNLKNLKAGQIAKIIVNPF